MKTSLFARVNRRLVPTSAGINLYQIVKNFILELEQGVLNINETAEKPSGLLRIGAPPEFGKTYIPQIFASFHQRYPDVSLHLELGDPKVLFPMVSAGTLDFAYIDILPIFIDIPGGASSYTIEPVVSEEFILACSQTYYAQNIQNIGIDNLINLEYIAYKSDLALFHSWFRLHFDTAPSSLKVVFTVDSAQAIIAAIEKDLGLGITVSHLMSQQISDGTIIPIQVTQKKLKNTIACVKFRDKVQTITETAFQIYFQQKLAMISDRFTQPPETPET